MGTPRPTLGEAVRQLVRRAAAIQMKYGVDVAVSGLACDGRTLRARLGCPVASACVDVEIRLRASGGSDEVDLEEA